MTPDELDGVAVAPNNHKVIFENDEVRVLETTIAAERSHRSIPISRRPSCTCSPGLTSSVATSTARRRSTRGRTRPSSFLSAVRRVPPGHTIENTGVDDLVVIGVELEHRHGR